MLGRLDQRTALGPIELSAHKHPICDYNVLGRLDQRTALGPRTKCAQASCTEADPGGGGGGGGVGGCNPPFHIRYRPLFC